MAAGAQIKSTGAEQPGPGPHGHDATNYWGA